MALTPAHEWEPIDVYQGYTTDWVFSLYDETAGVADEYEIASDDHIRFKMWPTPSGDAATPTLDLDSVGATTNGSVCTIDGRGTDGTTAAQVTVRFAQGDMTMNVGEYHGVLLWVDNSATAPADAAHVVAHGVVSVKGMPGGDKGVS